MSEDNILASAHPAEVHVEGVPRFAGQVTELHESGILLSKVRLLKEKTGGHVVSVVPGTLGELSFTKLKDDDGAPLIVPIKIRSATGKTLTLDFQDQVSIVTGTVMRKLKSKATETQYSYSAGEGSNNLLEQFKTRSVRELSKLNNDYLLACADHLFDLSSRPDSQIDHTALYDAMNIVKRSREDIQKVLTETFMEYFDNPLEIPVETDEEDADPGSVEFDELNLVDLHAFEDWLSIETIIRAGSELYSTQLECLTIRYANMIKEEDIDNVILPIHVKQICLAFQKSLEQQLIAHEVIPEIYNFFSERVIGKLAPIYSSLNTLLREGGILPDLENDIQKRGSAFVRRKSAKNNKKEKELAEKEALEQNGDNAAQAQQTQNQANQAAGQASPGNSPAVPQTASSAGAGAGAGSEERLISELTNVLKQHFDPSNLYKSVIEALDFNNSGGMPGAYHTPGPVPAGQAVAGGAAETQANGAEASGQPGAVPAMPRTVSTMELGYGGGQVAGGAAGGSGNYRIADEITLANALNQLQ